MESLGKQSDLMTRMSYIYCILPYYDYAYDSVKIIRSLCTKTRYLWTNQQDAIIRMFTKQTMELDRAEIDDKVIRMLKKVDRYKLFKFGMKINSNDEGSDWNLRKILNEMPDSQFSSIYVFRSTNKFLNTVSQILIDMNRQDLFKVIQATFYMINQESESLIYSSSN